MYISSGLYSIFSLDPDKCTPLYCKIVLKYIITYHQIQMYIVCTYYIRSNRICTTISWFKTIEAMRFNIVFIFLILAFFQTEIQARWSRILPKSKKNQPSEIQSTQKSTSKYFPFLPKQFQDKSIAKIYKGYCQFLLGASKECMEQFLKFKKGKFQDKPTTSLTSSATFSTTSTKTEKMHGRLEKYLEFELEQVWKNREKIITTTEASPLITTARKLAFIRIH